MTAYYEKRVFILFWARKNDTQTLTVDEVSQVKRKSQHLCFAHSLIFSFSGLCRMIYLIGVTHSIVFSIKLMFFNIFRRYQRNFWNELIIFVAIFFDVICIRVNGIPLENSFILNKTPSRRSFCDILQYFNWQMYRHLNHSLCVRVVCVCVYF